MSVPIKAICFDLDGVYFTPRGKSSFQRALTDEYGVPQGIADEFMYRSPEMTQLVRGQMTPETFWSRFRERTGITAPDQELADRWVRDYEVDQNVHATVLRARAQGLQTCVCTNNNEIRLAPLIERFHLRDTFDVIVSSHEVGHTKPSKEIFEALLEKLHVRPEELAYSDDNPDRLHGAQELGIEAFVFDNFDQFIDELKVRGVDLGQ